MWLDIRYNIICLSSFIFPFLSVLIASGEGEWRQPKNLYDHHLQELSHKKTLGESRTQTGTPPEAVAIAGLL